MIKQKCCPECGTKLIEKELEHEGLVPYCETCKEYRFPMFNTAVSMICKYQDNVLLIKQYNKPFYILVAGYLNLGEGLEDAVKREIKEEMNLVPSEITFNTSKYFPNSNTLMCNFILEFDDISSLKPNYEIDSYHWFKSNEVLDNIKPDSLAKWFYQEYLKK